MRIHIVMHESFETPAAIEAWALERHHNLSHTRLYHAEKFPEPCDFDFLVVMGGPQSPATTLVECPYFDAQNEIHFIQKAIQQHKLLLGVCLGAQLIGEALDAPFNHSPQREIGVFELNLTDAGQHDCLFETFPKKFLVGHWHGDMPGLTPDAQVLATSAGCPRQIVKYGPKIYGFQCHFEFTHEAVEGMLQHCSAELQEYQHLPYIQNATQICSHDYSVMNRLLFDFLDCFVRQIS